MQNTELPEIYFDFSQVPSACTICTAEQTQVLCGKHPSLAELAQKMCNDLLPSAEDLSHWSAKATDYVPDMAKFARYTPLEQDTLMAAVTLVSIFLSSKTITYSTSIDAFMGTWETVFEDIGPYLYYALEPWSSPAPLSQLPEHQVVPSQKLGELADQKFVHAVKAVLISAYLDLTVAQMVMYLFTPSMLARDWVSKFEDLSRLGEAVLSFNGVAMEMSYPV